MELTVNTKPLSLSDLNPAETIVVVVDMINGFTKEGALKSDRIKAVIDPIAELVKSAKAKKIDCIAFSDNHSEESPEFSSFPPHCLKGSSESILVEELEQAGLHHIFPKNSTNAFFAPGFQLHLQDHNYRNFIIAGNCTDICVLQFATTLKAYYNEKNQQVRVIVPKNLVETYDAPNHPADTLHEAALYLLQLNGIEIVDLKM